jgi:hypothetical protein
MAFQTYRRSRYSGTIRATIAEIRDLKKRMCTFDEPNRIMTQDELRAELERRFNLWWDSWIEPQLEHLARKDKKYVPKEQR